MNDQTLNKLSSVAQAIAEERGEFELFGLFMPMKTIQLWDVVASAPWLDANRSDGLRYLIKRIYEKLNPKEKLLLSATFIVDTDNPGIKRLRRLLGDRPLPAELNSFEVFDKDIDQAFIIRGKGFGAEPRSHKPVPSHS